MSITARKLAVRSIWLVVQTVGIGALMSAAGASPQAVPEPPLPQAPAPELTMAQLAAARYQAATQGYQFAIAGRQPTDAPGPDVLDWMRRRVKARLDLPEPKNDRVAFLKEYVQMLKSEGAFQERMVKSRLTGAESLLRAQYDRIEGEMLLRQAEAK